MNPQIAAISKDPRTDEHSSTCWGIAKIAAHFDITTRAIRFYEDKGLLSLARSGGHRVFSKNDKERLEKILRAKRIGFSLEDIKQFLDVRDGNTKRRAELLTRKQNFEETIIRLDKKRQDLEIITKEMQELCALIDNHLATAPTDSTFQFADAYDALFREHLDEDFITI